MIEKRTPVGYPAGVIKEEPDLVEIKDFQPGQTAFVVTQKAGRVHQSDIKRVAVLSVGRKYVKASPEGLKQPIDFYATENYPDCLIENNCSGDRRRLYLTEDAANEAIEADYLRVWMMKAVNYLKLKEYTLRQLRATKAILEYDDEFVSRSVLELFIRERDMAVEQLRSYGVQFGETTEVERVIHGQWIETGFPDIYQCSHCKKPTKIILPNDMIPTDLYSRCHWCGAKMEISEISIRKQK